MEWMWSSEALKLLVRQPIETSFSERNYFSHYLFYPFVEVEISLQLLADCLVHFSVPLKLLSAPSGDDILEGKCGGNLVDPFDLRRTFAILRQMYSIVGKFSRSASVNLG